jgi:hypothetical protein
MDITHWNMEDALAVRYEEGYEDGFELGLKEAREERLKKSKEETARKAIARGIPFELIRDITGLDMETIKNLAAAP